MKKYQLADYGSSSLSQCYARQEMTKCASFEYLQGSYADLEKTGFEHLKDFTVKSNGVDDFAFMEYEDDMLTNTILMKILDCILSDQHRTGGVPRRELIRKFKLCESENALCNAIEPSVEVAAYNSQCDINNRAECHSQVEDLPNDEVCIESSSIISLQSENEAERMCEYINEHSHNDSIVEGKKRQYAKTVSKSDQVEKLSPPQNASTMSMLELAMWYTPKVKCTIPYTTHTTSSQVAGISSIAAKVSCDNSLWVQAGSTKQCYDNSIAAPAPSLCDELEQPCTNQLAQSSTSPLVQPLTVQLSQPIPCTNQLTYNGCTLSCCSPGMPNAQYTEHETCRSSLPSRATPSDCAFEVLQTHEVVAHCEDQKLAQIDEQHPQVTGVSVGPTCKDFCDYLASCGSNLAVKASTACMDEEVCTPDPGFQVLEMISFSPVLLSKVYSLVHQAPNVGDLTADITVERNPFSLYATFQWQASEDGHLIETCKHLRFEGQNTSVQCPNHPVLPYSIMQPQIDEVSPVTFSSDQKVDTSSLGGQLSSTGMASKNDDHPSTLSCKFLPVIPSRKASTREMNCCDRVLESLSKIKFSLLANISSGSISVFRQQFKSRDYFLACATLANCNFAGLFRYDALQWIHKSPYSVSCMSISELPIQSPRQLSPDGAMPLVPHKFVGASGGHGNGYGKSDHQRDGTNAGGENEQGGDDNKARKYSLVDQAPSISDLTAIEKNPHATFQWRANKDHHFIETCTQSERFEGQIASQNHPVLPCSTMQPQIDEFSPVTFSSDQEVDTFSLDGQFSSTGMVAKNDDHHGTLYCKFLPVIPSRKASTGKIRFCDQVLESLSSLLANISSGSISATVLQQQFKTYHYFLACATITRFNCILAGLFRHDALQWTHKSLYSISSCCRSLSKLPIQSPRQLSPGCAMSLVRIPHKFVPDDQRSSQEGTHSLSVTDTCRPPFTFLVTVHENSNSFLSAYEECPPPRKDSTLQVLSCDSQPMKGTSSSSPQHAEANSFDIKVLHNPSYISAADSSVPGIACAYSETKLPPPASVINGQALTLARDIRGNNGNSLETSQQSSERHLNQNQNQSYQQHSQNSHNNCSGNQGSSGGHGNCSSQSNSVTNGKSDHQQDGTNAGCGNEQDDGDDDDDRSRKKSTAKTGRHISKGHLLMVLLLLLIICFFCIPAAAVFSICELSQPSPQNFNCDHQESEVHGHRYIDEFAQPSALLQPLNYYNSTKIYTDYQLEGQIRYIYTSVPLIVLVITALSLLCGHNSCSSGNQGGSGGHDDDINQNPSDNTSDHHQGNGTDAGGGNERGDNHHDDVARKKNSHLATNISWHILKRHLIMLLCLLFFISCLFLSVPTSYIDELAQPSSSLLQCFEFSTSTDHSESEVPIHGCMDEFIRLSFQQHFDYSPSTDCQESKVRVHSYTDEFSQPSLLEPLNYSTGIYTNYQGSEVQIQFTPVPLILSLMMVCAFTLYNGFPKSNSSRFWYIFLSLAIILQHTGISILLFFIVVIIPLFLVCVLSRDQYESSFDPGGSNSNERSRPRKGAFSKDGTHDHDPDVNLLLDYEGSVMVTLRLRYSFVRDTCSSMRCGNSGVCKEVSVPNISNSTLVTLDGRSLLQQYQISTFALPVPTAAPTSMLQSVKTFNKNVESRCDGPLVQDSLPAPSQDMVIVKQSESSSPILSSSTSSYLVHFTSPAEDSSYLPKLSPNLTREKCQECHDDVFHSAFVSNHTVNPPTSYLRKQGQIGRHNIDSSSVPSYKHNFIIPHEVEYQRERNMNRVSNDTPVAPSATTTCTIGPIPSSRSMRKICKWLLFIIILFLFCIPSCGQAQAISEVSRPDILLMLNNASSIATPENFVLDIAIDNSTCSTTALDGIVYEMKHVPPVLVFQLIVLRYPFSLLQQRYPPYERIGTQKKMPTNNTAMMIHPEFSLSSCKDLTVVPMREIVTCESISPLNDHPPDIGTLLLVMMLDRYAKGQDYRQCLPSSHRQIISQCTLVYHHEENLMSSTCPVREYNTALRFELTFSVAPKQLNNTPTATLIELIGILIFTILFYMSILPWNKLVRCLIGDDPPDENEPLQRPIQEGGPVIYDRCPYPHQQYNIIHRANGRNRDICGSKSILVEPYHGDLLTSPDYPSSLSAVSPPRARGALILPRLPISHSVTQQVAPGLHPTHYVQGVVGGSVAINEQSYDEFLC